MAVKCMHCKKDCKKTVKYQNMAFCCEICVEKYKKKHKPKVCEFC